MVIPALNLFPNETVGVDDGLPVGADQAAGQKAGGVRQEKAVEDSVAYVRALREYVSDLQVQLMHSCPLEGENRIKASEANRSGYFFFNFLIPGRKTKKSAQKKKEPKLRKFLHRFSTQPLVSATHVSCGFPSRFRRVRQRPRPFG